MKLDAVNNHAHNGVRIVLNSKIVLLCVLAFLCIAIVSLCVFNNLNALATNNIAFADEEEPTRVINNTGELEWNYLPDNYILDRVISEYITNQSFYVLCSDDFVELRVSSDGNLTISNNSFIGSNNLYFTVYIKDYTHFANMVGSGSYCSLILFKATTGSGTFGSYNIEYYSNNTWTNFAACSNNSSNAWLRGSINFLPSANGNYCRIKCSTSGNIQLRAVGLYRANANVAYVPKSYLNYGYDQGYEDGLNAGGGSGGSSDPEFPVSSGLVGGNLMPNSNLSSWTYTARTGAPYGGNKCYEDDNWIYYLPSIGNSVSTVYMNRFTYVSNTTTGYGYFDFRLKDPSILESGKYTFTFGWTAYGSSDMGFYCEVQTTGTDLGHYWVDAEAVPDKSYISITFDTSDIIDNSLAFSLYIHDLNDYIDFNFIKLEVGEVFTGYQVETNYNSGYVDGYVVGYNHGFIAGGESVSTIWTNTDTSFGVYDTTGDYDTIKTLTSLSVYCNQVGHAGYYAHDLSFYLSFNDNVVIPIGASIKLEFPLNFELADNSSNEYIFYVRFANQFEELPNLVASEVGADAVLEGREFNNLLFVVPRNCNIIFFTVKVTKPSQTTRDTSANQYLASMTFLNNPSYIIANVPNDITQALADEYEKGYNLGLSNGRVIGYNEGASSSNTFTFTNLISSVIEAPISALFGKKNVATGEIEGGMLNFRLLGMDMRAFALAMFSFAIVLFIWKLIVRGG